MRKLAWQCLVIVGLLLVACWSDRVTPVPVTTSPGPRTVPLAAPSIDLLTPEADPQHEAEGAPLPTGPMVPSRAPVTWTSMPAGFTVRKLHGDLANQVARLETGMPGAGSGGFALPTNPEKEAFGALAARLVAGQPGQTAEVYGYEIIRYAGRGDAGAESLMLHEREPVQGA